jgi:hypothetical protein
MGPGKILGAIVSLGFSWWLVSTIFALKQAYDAPTSMKQIDSRTITVHDALRRLETGLTLDDIGYRLGNFSREKYDDYPSRTTAKWWELADGTLCIVFMDGRVVTWHVEYPQPR